MTIRHLLLFAVLAGIFVPVRVLGNAVLPRVVSETNGEIVVELIDARSTPQAWVGTFVVAIPPTGSYTVLFDPGVLDGSPPVYSQRVTGPEPFRGGRILHVWMAIGAAFGGASFTVNPTVSIQYPTSASTNPAADADPWLRDFVINEQIFPRSPRTGGADPFLSRNTSWMRIRVLDRGMYQISGTSLGAFTSLATVDPATFRLYTMMAENQPRDFADPDGTWQRGVTPRETAIEIVDVDGDGMFDTEDRIVFYGLGPADYRDYYEPGASDSTFHLHTHARFNEYLLTWGGAVTDQKRIATRVAAPAGGTARTTSLHRNHREFNRVPKLPLEGDGWIWLESNSNSLFDLETVAITDLVASRPQQFRTIAIAPDFKNHQMRYWVIRGGSTIQLLEFNWSTRQSKIAEGIPVRVNGSLLVEGGNRFAYQTTQANDATDRTFVAWFDLRYERYLRARQDRLAFTSPDTFAVVDFAAIGFGAAPAAYDVTDPFSPVRLTGATFASGTARFASTISGQRQHFELATPSGLRPAAMTRLTSTDLRNDAEAPHMLIVTDEELRSEAERLAAHRRSHMAYYASPRVKVVTTQEVYDNFSGGLADPMAIRNYVRFLYDNYNDGRDNSPLTFLLLFGDATLDWRNHVTAAPDRVPTNVQYDFSEAFATDQWYGHMDATDLVPGHGIGDIAVGRVPAATVPEAKTIVDKIIGYDTASPRTPWRQRVIFVADDEVSGVNGCIQFEATHTIDSERVISSHLANFLEPRKIYLTEYDEIAGVKPKARFELLDEWNAGALVMNYIGHGSTRQMADEQVFLEADVSLLNNGFALPIVAGLSCTIGDFANMVSKSLSEKLLIREGGGAIATITASEESFADRNAALARALYDRITPNQAQDRPVPLGIGVESGRASSLLLAGLSGASQEDNNWKYNYLGDPAQVLAYPKREVRLDPSSPDTLVAGVRTTVSGSVLLNDVVDTSFNGVVNVRIGEPEVDRDYVAQCSPPFPIDYALPGGIMFDGTADVRDGRFTVNFRVPRAAETGPKAFFAAYADAGAADAGAVLDSTLVIVSPTVADSLLLRPIDGAPRVTLRFRSGLAVVKPGETVVATVRDSDGINTLETTNEGRQAILIDNLAVPIEVGDFFNLDHGGVDTSGVLEYPLPDLDFGPHRLIYKVADSFGQTRLDTLLFNVTDINDYYAEVPYNYPNPFREDTRFLFRFSDRAELQLDIFTVSGRRIRRIEGSYDAGEQWVYWDGRDVVGDPIGNGSYLYVARVKFSGLDRPEVVLRGAVSKLR